MDFTFTADQIALSDAVHKFLMVEAAPEMLREIWETESGRSRTLRAKLAEQGVTALSVPEAFGGMGISDLAWALVHERLGYYAIPDSLSDTAYLAASLIADLPDSAHAFKTEWLPKIAEGHARIAIAHPINPLVADAEQADLLLVYHQGALHAVAPTATQLRYNRSIDASRRLFELDFSPSPASELLDAQRAVPLWAKTVNRASLAQAGQLLGLAARMLDLGVDYSAQRKQFGKPIGSFQAVKHHMADVAVKLEFAKPVFYRAAFALTEGDIRSDALISHAKLVAGEAALLAARKSIQVHGAMGYTWEADLQMFMKRAWAMESAWGDRATHKVRLTQHVLAANALLGPAHIFTA